MDTAAENIFLSVVIPCYNEAENIEAGRLAEVFAWLSAQSRTYEVIIVDDGSSDKSPALLAAAARNHEDIIIVRTPHRGKPFAVRAGAEAARGEVVLFTDLDHSTPIEELPKLLCWYGRGFNAVIGSRGPARMGNSLMRKAGSRLFGFLRRLVILPDIRDTQCGFKLFRRSVLAEALTRLRYFSQASGARGWKVSAWDVELLYVLQESGTEIKEVEVAWRNRDCSSGKRIHRGRAKYIAESFEMALEVLRVACNRMKGHYRD